MKILSIEPTPTQDEAAAIVAALESLGAHASNARYPELRSGCGSRVPLDPLHLTWREAARLEAVDGGV